MHSNLMVITTYNNCVILDNDWLKCLSRDIIILLRGGSPIVTHNYIIYESPLNEFDEIVSKKLHDIRNCLTIEYTIRLIIDIPVIGKMGYHTSKKHKRIED